MIFYRDTAPYGASRGECFHIQKHLSLVSIVVVMRITTLSFVLVLFALACSHRSRAVSPIAIDCSKPHFEFAASDLATPAVISTNGVGSGHDTIIIKFRLSTGKAAELARFTQEHARQQTQL